MYFGHVFLLWAVRRGFHLRGFAHYWTQATSPPLNFICGSSTCAIRRIISRNYGLFPDPNLRSALRNFRVFGSFGFSYPSDFLVDFGAQISIYCPDRHMLPRSAYSIRISARPDDQIDFSIRCSAQPDDLIDFSIRCSARLDDQIHFSLFDQTFRPT